MHVRARRPRRRGRGREAPMKVGYAYICQNPMNQSTDYECHRAERRLARPRRAARLRLVLERRAPLHRLHHGARRAAAPLLRRRAHAEDRARQHGGGPALARPDAGRRGDLAPRLALRRPLHPRHRPRRRPRRVRGLPHRHGRVARALRRVRRDDPQGSRDRLLRVRRQVHQAAEEGHPAGARSSRSAGAPTPPRCHPSRRASWPSSASAS